MSKQYFSNLTYSIGDEDNNVEFQVLPVNRNHIVSVCGSGTRIIPFLSKNPKKITCVDISQEQLDLTYLRIEAIKQLDYQSYLAFLGYPPMNINKVERKQIFDSLIIENDIRIRLQKLLTINDWKEIIYYGKFEKAMIKLSKINRFITGKTGKSIFNQSSFQEQEKYYLQKFSKFRFNITIGILGNTSVLNSILYKGQFPKKNIEGSYFKNFKTVFHNIFTKINIQESFFIQLIFMGKISNPAANLLEANEIIFNNAKQNIESCVIDYVNGDITQVIKNSKSNEIDFVSYSDVPSFFSDDKASTFLQEIKNNIASNCIIISKGFLRISSPNFSNYTITTDDYNPIIETDKTQLWKYQIYNKI